MGAYNFTGKVTVVTGGRRGIGLDIVQALQMAGAIVVVVAQSSDGPGMEYYCRDLSKPIMRQGLIKHIVGKLGRIDILVNNAGSNYFDDAQDFPLEAWNRLIELMLTAPFDLAQQAFPYMKAQGGGKIINVTSIAGFQGTRRTVAYSVAKHGLIGLTKCLSNEWTPYGINVNAVAPGYTDTELISSLTEDRPHSEAMLGRIPAGRYGKPEEIANAVMWLASDQARYVCGTTLVVDGGWLAR
jgi:2-deoxy-D-gluconate 3-dehydrogenase